MIFFACGRGRYQELMMSITRALVSDFNLEECAVIVEEDWRMDTGQVPPNGSMSERQLCKSLFELVDTWVDSIQATDYLEWLQGLFSGTPCRSSHFAIEKHLLRTVVLAVLI